MEECKSNNYKRQSLKILIKEKELPMPYYLVLDEAMTPRGLL